MSLVMVFTAIYLKAQTTVTVNSNITANTTWTSNNIYLLSGGFIYVTNNATLTIQPGTLIKGTGAALVITRGSKIVADGTRTQPIVFTSSMAAGSRNPGDWGGLLILGNATINDPAGERLAEGGIDPVLGLYGGTNDDDSSGVLRYVRVEYAGIAFQPNNETNGITFGAVGRKTLVDYVQVSYGGDDAFEFFGGTVNAKHLIANKTVDDMYDSDYGYRGKLQFIVGVSDSTIADISGSNGFESDNDASGSTNAPFTQAIFSNVSIFGPKVTNSTVINSNFKRALHLKKTTKTSTYNSVFAGFPTGIKVEGTATAANVTSGELQFKNNIIAGSSMPLDSSAMSFGMQAWFNNNANTILANPGDVMATNAYSYTNPNFLPATGSPMLSGADFTSTALTDPFFTPVTFRGAFGASDWSSCWSEFDPNNKAYSTSPINNGPVASASETTSTTTVNFTNTSTNAASYFWDFGDGNTSTATSPSHTYSADNNYTVTLIAYNGTCTDTATFTVSIVSGINSNYALLSASVFPNPSRDVFNIDYNSLEASSVDVTISDLSGRLILEENHKAIQGKNNFKVSVRDLEEGLYFLTLQTPKGKFSTKVLVKK